MQKFDSLQKISVNILMLKLVGLWPEKRGSYKPNLYTLYAFISVVGIMGSHNFFQTMNICFVYKDLEALAASIFITTTDVLVSVKMCFFIQNINIVKKVILSLNDDAFQPKSKKQVQMLRSSLNFWKLVYVWYFAMVGITSTIWLILPILTGTFQNKQLPLDAWYFYNTTTSPLYEITYVYQCVAIAFLVVSTINIDSLILAMMIYIIGQCDNLCDSLKHLEVNEKQNVHKWIIKCIKHHKKILSFAEDGNQFFDKIILGQFATSTAVLASTMFQLSLVNPFSAEGLIRILYTMAVTTQIFIYCWFGNEVELKVRTIIIYMSRYGSKWNFRSIFRM
ncbi:hypothetical protein Zmor_007614 [Zophobas morio]|uniref:7tm 6 domain containing protein n=1 Tax=Zophobas morio TaxID=2755281 RepID=A0AA38MPY7_9CUCU|nr:hypothetical protein Zmor_007614 [Zophobas morio]